MAGERAGAVPAGKRARTPNIPGGVSGETRDLVLDLVLDLVFDFDLVLVLDLEPEWSRSRSRTKTKTKTKSTTTSTSAQGPSLSPRLIPSARIFL